MHPGHHIGESESDGEVEQVLEYENDGDDCTADVGRPVNAQPRSNENKGNK